MRCAVPRPISSTPMSAGTPVRASWRAASGAASARRSAPRSKISNGEVHVGTWATRDPGGFTDAHRAALERLIAPLARVTENYALRRTATNLLDTYVGRDAGARILAGSIRRGFSETIRAAI